MKNLLRFLVLTTLLFFNTNFLHLDWVQTSGSHDGHDLYVTVSCTNLFAETSIALSFATLETSVVPTIISFSPLSGPVGSSVIITGTNFSTSPTSNIVYFGAVRAMVTSATSTLLTVIVPTGATYQPISVTVNELTAYSSKPFIVTFSGVENIDVNSFAPKVDFATGENPAGLTISDIDSDGKADLIVANCYGNSISVFRNTSSLGSITSGSLAAKVDFTTENPVDLVIGDLDGDGKPDLVALNASMNTASIFRNTSSSGSITFAAPVVFSTGWRPYFVVIRDLDGDGKPDLVIANHDNNTVSIFRNTCSLGSISFAAQFDLATVAYPWGLAVGDIDGDGKPDLVVCKSGSQTVSVFRNTSSPGSITFAANVDFTTGTAPVGVAIGDIDGDEKPDLVVTNQSSNTVSLFRNTSSSGSITTGSFAARVDFAIGTASYIVKIGDINGDGKPDLVVISANSGIVSVFRNISSSGSITTGSFAARVDFTTGAWPTHVTIGDIDGDGKPDLAVTNAASNTFSIFRNTVPIVYTITSSAGPNGSITPSGLVQVNSDGNASFTISPDIDYHIEDVLVDGASVGALSSYQFSNVTASHTIAATFATDPGTISGSILVGTSGLANVTVNLLDNQLSLISYIVTGPSGGYTFSNLTPGTYNIMIVEPLGYFSDGNPKQITVNPGGNYQVNFILTPVTITNNNRGMGYWKQQFDKYITKKGNAQETEVQLNDYINRVHQYYTPHFNVFNGLTTFANWQAVLSPTNNSSMLNKARQHLAALVMNFVSFKIGQGVVVTADGRTAGDLLTYVSTLVTGSDATKYELAKNLAEQVCNQQTIAANLVPVGNVLYKNSSGLQVNWNFDVPKDFSLLQNYPNPFNPTTSISFSIPQSEFVTLKIYDVIGKEVANLVNEFKDAGNYKFNFDASKLSSGIYLYRLHAGNFTTSKKMMLIK